MLRWLLDQSRTNRLCDRSLAAWAAAVGGDDSRAAPQYLDCLELEDRTLFSASPAGLGLAPKPLAPPPVAPPQVPVAPPAPAAPAGPSNPLAPSTTLVSAAQPASVTHELVFIDTTLPDYQQLVAAVQALNSPQRQISIVLLNDNDGIEQITQALAQYHDLSAVHFLAHGTDDSVDLGGTWLQESNISAYAGQIAAWQSALAPGASLLFYGCDLAAGAGGQALLEDIHTLTGAGVAANTQATGNLSEGGDWTLDYQLGSVDTALPFNPAALADWDGLMATYTVTTTADSGAGSLRSAIESANSHPGLNTITFDIAGSGVQTINLLTALPVISNEVIIDGTSQPGYAGTPLIVLNGAAAGAGTNGLTISAGSSTVKGLDIENFNGIGIDLPNGGSSTIVANFIGTDPTGSVAAPNAGGGIYIDNSANNVVGGTTAALRNVISGNGGDGIDVFGPSSTANTIEGNYIGTDAAGSAALGNAGYGIYVSSGASSNIIGGAAAGARNIISGNAQYGVYISDGTTNDNSLLGNYIGTDATGAVDVSNGGWGVAVDNGATNTVIGGTAAGDGNVISGNVDASSGEGIGGIYVYGTGTVIEGNIIGLNAAKSAALANGSTALDFTAGIYVTSGSSDTTIGGTTAAAANTIQDNVGAGVAVVGAGDTATIEGNSIYGNSGLGIDLNDDGVTPNHAGGLETGPNGYQNYPVLSVVSSVGGHTEIAGTLNAADSTAYRIEFFSSPAADPSGYGQGATYLGFATVTTNSSGNATFTAILSTSLPAGDVVAATATDPNGNTSEFSADITTVNNVLVVNTASDAADGSNTSSVSALLANPGTGGVISLRDAITAINNTTPGSSPFQIWFNIPGSGAQVITLSSALPTISKPMIINGETQPGYAGTPLVEINGAGLPSNDNDLVVSADNVTIRGLAIHGATDGNGIQVNDASGTVIQADYVGISAAGTTSNDTSTGIVLTDATNSLIGGTAAADRNIISGSTNGGIRLESGASDNLIEGNYIGTNVAGTAALANDTYGIQIQASPDNTIGGTTAGAANVISGNSGRGVDITGAASTGNVLEGNLIGTNAQGTAAVANTDGVEIEAGAANNMIGGTSAAAANVISGNSKYGVYLYQDGGSNLVEGNDIGTGPGGSGSLGNKNAGVWIDGSSDDTIGGTAAGDANIIADTLSGNGVTVVNSGVDDAIEANSIYGNSGLGIDLNDDGVTANHAGGPTSGPNGLENYPVLTSAATDGSSSVTIAGSINTGDDASVRIEFFASPTADSSGNGQGQQYLGYTTVTTSSSGNASFNVTLDATVSNGAYISATATDVTAGGDTSEFSANVTAGHANVPPVNTVPGAQSVNENATLTFSAANSNAISVADSDSGGNVEQISISVGNGTLTLAGTTGLTFTAGSNGSASMTVQGTLVNLNNALNGLAYTPATNYSGSDTLTLVANDLGNTGAGGPQTATSTVGITVGHVDEAPVNSVPGPQTTPDATPLVFSSAQGNAISVSDADSGGNAEQITLSVSNGTLTLAGTTGLTITAGSNGSAGMTVQGTLVNLNNALNGLTYVSTAYYSGTDTLTLVTNDLGNTGAGGAQQATSTVTINVTHVNQPPVNTVPGPQATDEGTPLTFSSAGGNAISVADPDGGSNPELVSLSVTNGTLMLNGTSGLTIMSGANGSSAVSVQGTLADLNVALNGLVYTPTAGYYGPAGLGISTDDLGHSGSGGAQTTTSSVSITVNEVNQPPVNTVPAAQSVADATPLVFSTARGNAISVSDVDSDGGVEQISLSVSNGTLTLAGTTGLNFTVGSNGSANMTVQGTLANLNAALNGLTYVSTQYFNGADTLNLTTNDLGNSGAGGAQQASSAVTINVTHTNLAPVNTVPAAQSVTDATPLVFSTAKGNAISVSDADAQGGVEQIALSVANGTLTLGGTTGINITAGSNGSASMTVQGTLANLNAALNGLTYVSTQYFNGADTLNLTTNDLGNSGAGGAQQASSAVTINVTHTNLAPVNTVPAAQSVADATPLVFSTAQGNAISVSDADSEGGVEQIALSVSNGTLTLGSTTGINITVGSNGSANMTVQGTLANLNAALNGLTYVSTQYFNGTDTLNLTTNDLGNSGAGGAQQASSAVTINVTHTNLAPVNTVPAAQNVADATPLVFSTAKGNAISVSDADSEGGVEQIALSVGNGTLTLGGTTGINITAGSNGSASMTVQGTLANLNAALNGLTYVSTQYFNGADTLNLVTNDLGNSGAGGAQQASSAVTINVTHTNLAPVNTVPAAQTTNENAPLVFSTANGNALSVSDADAQGGVEQITLAVGNGTLTLAGTTGLSFTAGSNGSAAMTVQGTLANLNAALNGLTYTPNQYFFGADTLTLATNDLGHSGVGGPLSATSQVGITVSQAAPPTVSLPESQSTTAATLVFSQATGNAITVSEFDAGQSPVQITITGSGGTMTLGTTANVVLSAGTGSGDTTVVFTGTLAQVNAALDGLAFRPMGQSSQMSITINDMGYGNPAVARSTTAVVAVSQTILPMMTPPASGGTSGDSSTTATPDTAATSSATTASDPTATSAAATTGSGTAQSSSGAFSAQAAQTTQSSVSARVANMAAPVSAAAANGAAARNNITEGQDRLATTKRLVDGGTTDGNGQNRAQQDAYTSALLAAGMPGPLRSPAMAAALQHRWVDVVATDWMQLAGLSANKTPANDGGLGWAVGSALGLSTAFSVGYVLWCLRGGYLLATALSAVPMWRNFDPLPVLDQVEQDLPQRGKRKKSGQPVAGAVPAADDEQELDEILLDR